MSPPCCTTSWQDGRPPRVFGGNFSSSARRGSRASFSMKPWGTFISSSSEIRQPTSSSLSTPSARQMRRIEPNRLMATGTRLTLPSSMTGCSNIKAGPPSGLFMHRSATSAISSRVRTGSRTRTSSPIVSIAAMNSCRLSSAIEILSQEVARSEEREGGRPGGPSRYSLPPASYVDRAHAPEQRLIPHRSQPRAAHPLGQIRRPRKGGHRLWQPCVGIPMFRDETSDQWQQVPEVGEVRGAKRVPERDRELEHHQPGARLEHADRLAETGIEVGEVPDPEADHGPVEYRVTERQRHRVGVAGNAAHGLRPAPDQHSLDEVGGNHAAGESGPTPPLGGEVHRTGAEIEIGPLGSQFPAEPVHRQPPPAAITVEAQEMIEQVVARRDRLEHPPDVAPLLGPAGDR